MRRDERGQSLVEWALILPILIMFFIGLIDFGWAFSKQHSINQITKELARSASIGETITDLKDEAFELSKAVLAADTITHTENNNTSIFTIADPNGKQLVITFDESLTTRSKGKKFNVKIDYVYEPITPIVSSTDIPLSAQYYTKAETLQSN
jgi:Flp pilus assembly protein TadG